MSEHLSAREPTRRTVLAGTVAGSALVALGCKAAAQTSEGAGAGPRSSDTGTAMAIPTILRGTLPHELPPLPYAENALEPHISARTLSFHYGKHHKTYVENTNTALKDAADLASLPLEDLIKKVAGDSAKTALFNNAAQLWNHTFYWKSMSPKGGGQPTGKLLEKINASFGGYDKFKEAFATAGKTQFGSGWAWLVADGDKLAVVKTPNAETPMAQGKKCLLTMDVWEHAYYLDYQNQRPNYITAFLDHLVNWEFAAANLG
jgi:superoxide dismutase, Fe-Mn family